MQSAGLRERKKSATRVHIADVAAEMFRRDGYDAVTVEAVAEAAGVSKKTVFNYFPTKEDLVFDRAEDRAAGLLAAIEVRPAGVSVLESFRALCLGQVGGLANVRAELAAGGGGFFDLVRSHPMLQRKMHEVHAGLIRTVARALAEEAGEPDDDPVAAVVAGALLVAQRTLYQRLRDRAAGPASDSTIRRAHQRDTNRVFDQLRDGLADYPHPAGSGRGRQ